MKFRYLSILLLCVFLVTGCQKKERFSEVFFNSTCLLPCWNGLDPGVSTESDLQNWLASNHEIDASKISWIEDQGPFNAIYTMHFKDIEVGSTLFYKNDQLYALSMSGKLNISLQDLLEKIGTPESIVVIHTVRAGKVFGDTFVDVINLTFPNSGIIATFWSNDIDHLNVAGDDLIEQLVLVDAGNFPDCLDLIVSPYYVGMDTYDWQGYGNYPR